MLRRYAVQIGGIIGAAIVASSLLIAPAAAKVTYDERVKPFELGEGIQTERQLWTAIRTRGATKHGQRSTTVGWASWSLKYRITYARRGETCTATNVDVGVDVVLNLPFWSFVDRARPALRDTYACIKDTVTVHEQRHGDIAREVGELLERRFWRDLSRVSCNRRSDEAQRIFKQVFEHGRRRQAEFDRVDYGRNRYQRCVGPSRTASLRNGGWLTQDRNPTGRSSVTGRRSQPRTYRVASSRRDRASSEQRQERTRETGRPNDEELQKRFRQDSREGQDDGRDGDGEASEPTDFSARPSGDHSGEAWDTSAIMRSTLGLFAALAIVICVGVWRIGRRNRAAAAKPETFMDDPEWKSQAIEAAARAKASVEGDRPGDDTARGSAPEPQSPAGRKKRTPKAGAASFGRRQKLAPRRA
ncbi:MAG: DUF922 domain-containing protein [Pseudomonadota bacterium]